ncbi:MAG: hypothetical protein JWO75_102, partial [Actinomycetia bacterium]|nr:hypothetical protein [Actinomycetes bacterium]
MVVRSGTDSGSGIRRLSTNRRERLPGLPSSGPSARPGIVKRQEVDMTDTLDWNAKTIAEFR